MLRIYACLALATFVFAFDGSAPFLMAQGKGQGGVLPKLRPAVSFEEAIESIPCSEATLIFDQPHVDASDLSRFSESFSALKAMMTAESSIAIPYARGDNAVEAIVSKLQQKCDITSQVKAVKGSDTLSLKDSKIFVSELMTFAGSLSNQQVAASTNDETMTSLIEQIKSLTPNHVVIFTSSKPAGQGLARRSVGNTVSSSTTNSTFVPFKDRTFLQKYVLFNMGVFEGSISLFLVSFVSLIGVNLLRSVQTPTKFEEPARH